nr:MAG TPA: hypothetical protein [Caudoviricetes sp.]
MSLYTKGEKIKSLWHPITDEDFDIDFSKPFIVCTDEGSLLLFDGLQDLYENYMDEEQLFDFEAQTLSEEGKENFRTSFFGYMYLDEEFYKAIDYAKGEYLEDVKGERERPALFVMHETGPMVFDHFSFGQSGSPAYDGTPNLRREFAARHPELYHIEYIVNLNHVSATSLNALFMAPTDKSKTAYVVTSGEYSDYHIDGVFSEKEKADFFADKDGDRSVEEYDIDDEQMLRQENWYEVKIYVGESLETKDVSVLKLSYNSGNKIFDAVMFSKPEGDSRYFSFYLAAINRGKAKAIALERFHALLAVESSHFPMLRCVRIVCPWRSYKIWESLVFGYFDYKAYFCPNDKIETTQDLFMKIKDYLPMPLTEEDENNIDWQNLTEETCLQLMRNHGLDIELKKNLSYVFYD